MDQPARPSADAHDDSAHWRHMQWHGEKKSKLLNAAVSVRLPIHEYIEKRHGEGRQYLEIKEELEQMIESHFNLLNRDLITSTHMKWLRSHLAQLRTDGKGKSFEQRKADSDRVSQARKAKK